jgi:hypothetical protein
MKLRSIATGLILTLSIAGVALAQEPQAAAQLKSKRRTGSNSCDCGDCAGL